jgi:bifunctional DNase/RNase
MRSEDGTMFGLAETNGKNEAGIVEVQAIKIEWLPDFGKQAVILSEIAGNRCCALTLDEWGANAIELLLNQISKKPYRLPASFSCLLENLEVKIKSVLIRRHFDGELVAQIAYWFHVEKKTIVHTPGEAIELALRCRAPIYLATELFASNDPSHDNPGARLYNVDSDLEALSEKLERAIELEDYEKAVEIRDEIMDYKRGTNR